MLIAFLIFFLVGCLTPIFTGVFREWSTKQRQRQREEHVADVLEAQRQTWAYDIRVIGGSGARR